MSPPSSVRLTWVLTGVLVTLCALLAGPDAWAAADGHKWESLACFLDLSGVWWAWGVVSATRGSTQLSLSDPRTFLPWMIRSTADAYFFPVDSGKELLRQPFGEAGLVAAACAADSAYFLLELAGKTSSLLVAEGIKAAGQAHACLAGPPPPPVDKRCRSRPWWALGRARAVRSCAAADRPDGASYCARLPWYAMKLLVIGALPTAYSGTHAYFLLDQIELAHDLHLVTAHTRPP